jgi:hypothetical protein
MTKIYHNRDLIGRFTCDGKKSTEKIVMNKSWLRRKLDKAIYAFKVFKFVMKKGIQVAVVCTFLAGATAGVFTAGRTSTTATFVQAEDKSSQILQDKIEALKDDVVTQLLDCERAGHKDEDGLVTYDATDAQFEKFLNTQTKQTVVDRGEMSYGVLQFKKSTVKYFVKLQTGKDITGKEALMIALDEPEARKLAKFVAFETKNKMGKDWKNCTIKHNLDEKIDIIKQLEK